MGIHKRASTFLRNERAILTGHGHIGETAKRHRPSMAMGDESGTIRKDDDDNHQAEINRPQGGRASKARPRRTQAGSAPARQSEGRKDGRESYARTHAGACSSRPGINAHSAAEQGRASGADREARGVQRRPES